MAIGKYSLLVDWNNDGSFGGAQDDISSDVLEISYSRGRDFASQLTGNSIAGKLTATLVNNDGKYSPDNTSSTLTGLINPGLPIQLAGGDGSSFPYDFSFTFSEIPQWVGRLERILPSPSSTDLKTATLEGFGVLGYLNDFIPNIETQTDKRTDEAIDAILDAVGWPDADRDLAEGETTMTKFWVSDKKTIAALRIPEETESGFLYETKDGKIGFQSRQTRLKSPFNTSQATFSDASGATNTYMRIEQADPLSTIANHLEASVRTYTTGALAVLWTLAETGANSPVFAPNESRTFIAKYPTSISDSSALEVDTWTIPASTTDYIANSASDGTGTNLTGLMGVSVGSRTATDMVISITNLNDTNAYLTKLQARGTPVTSSDPATIRAIDTDSQESYGERKVVAFTDFIPNTDEAQFWCDYHLQIYSSPVQILSMTISAPASAGNLVQAIERNINDRITVVATNDAQLGINADFFIEAERHLITTSGDHVFTWDLSPAEGGYSQFWVLNTGKLGTSTVPAF